MPVSPEKGDNSSGSTSESAPLPERRARRSWTEAEDECLKEAILLVEGSLERPPRQWHEIAQHVPGRSNKDCRKRWYGQMERPVNRGAWTPEEDSRLSKAVEKYGNQWSVIAAAVVTRSGDQCAKRWIDALNPSIDRSPWNPNEDATIMNAVDKHGRAWAQIARTYLPGRTGLATKNRYNVLCRAMAPRPRKRRLNHGSLPRASEGLSDDVMEGEENIAPKSPSETLSCAEEVAVVFTPEQSRSTSLKTEAISPELAHSLFSPASTKTKTMRTNGHAHAHAKEEHSDTMRSRQKTDHPNMTSVTVPSPPNTRTAAGASPRYVPYQPNDISQTMAYPPHLPMDNSSGLSRTDTTRSGALPESSGVKYAPPAYPDSFQTTSAAYDSTCAMASQDLPTTTLFRATYGLQPGQSLSAWQEQLRKWGGPGWSAGAGLNLAASNTNRHLPYGHLLPGDYVPHPQSQGISVTTSTGSGPTVAAESPLSAMWPSRRFHPYAMPVSHVPVPPSASSAAVFNTFSASTSSTLQDGLATNRTPLHTAFADDQHGRQHATESAPSLPEPRQTYLHWPSNSQVYPPRHHLPH